MKSLIAAVASLLTVTLLNAQEPNHGFGGHQETEGARWSVMHSDLNYAGDTAAYHTMDVYLPEKGEGPFPVVMHIYGSAWFSNNSKRMADINTICAALLDAGYAVATPNHRSSTDAKYPAQINDIKAAVRYLRAKGDSLGLDTRFVGISGFSSGAHLASLMGATNGVTEKKVGNAVLDLEGKVGSHTDMSSRVDAVCEWSGPIDLLHMDCAGPSAWKPSPEEVVMGFPLEGNEDAYRLLSPACLLDGNAVPYLVMHGTADNIVPVCQGRIMDEALTKAGVEHRYVEVEGGGHGVGMYTPENLAAMVQFFNSKR